VRLEDIEAIKRLKYKYMRCIDCKLWDEVGDLFTDDARVAYSGGKYSYEGRDAIVKFLSESMSAPSFHSSHRVHHPEIDFTGEDTATGIWALEDVVIETKLGFSLRGAAFYHDEYVREAGSWKIRVTGYTRTYEEIQMRSEEAGPKLTASQWQGDGRSEIDV
jgi:hypothetical protein